MMARSTAKSLAGSAASAARKVLGRAPAKKAAPAKNATAKKAPAKKAPAKKAPAKKAPAKKAPAEKVVAKKPAAKKVPAKKVPAKKVPAKKVPAKKVPAAAKAPVKKKPAAKQASGAKKAPAKKAPAKKAPSGKPSAKKSVSSSTLPKKQATPTKKAVKKTAPAATAAAKKATTSVSVDLNPKALPVKSGETKWTKGQIESVVKDLEEHQQRLSTLLRDQEADLADLMRDSGDGAGLDQADMGATSFERDQELSVVTRERETLAQIDRALERIGKGTFGTCESCGEPIGKMRVMAFPRATLCVECKKREERR